MATKQQVTTAVDQVKTAQTFLVQALSIRRARIAEINASITQAQSQIEALRSAPISLDDFGVYLRAHVDKLGADWMGVAANIIGVRWETDIPANAKSWADFEPNIGEIRGDSVFNEKTKPGLWNKEQFGMLCFFFPAEVTAKLMAAYRAKCGETFGNAALPTITSRRETVAATALQIQTLETELAAVEAEVKLMTEGIFPA